MAQQRYYGILHLCGGIGGGSLGYDWARFQFRGLKGRFVNLGSIDVDDIANQSFQMFTGVTPTTLDLFSREQYTAFHGKPPPRHWTEADETQIRKATGKIAPRGVFISTPCPGFSGLLPKGKAESPKYQALNDLFIRALFLYLEAWKGDLADWILMENVPRIEQRGKNLIARVVAMLSSYGYAVSCQSVDIGEEAGMSQTRRRFRLFARLVKKMPFWTYQPQRLGLKPISAVLEQMPYPDDPAGGPMNRLSRLQWRTWVRLALIDPRNGSGDWKDLQGIKPGDFSLWRDPTTGVYFVVRGDAGRMNEIKLDHEPRSGSYSCGLWEEPSGAIVSSARVGGSNGQSATTDPRYIVDSPRFNHIIQVANWADHGPCVSSGTGPSSGGVAVGDPRGIPPGGSWPGLCGVVPWDDNSDPVTGSAAVSSSNMRAAAGDPRFPEAPGQPVEIGARLSDSEGRHAMKYKTQPFDDPGTTVTGQHDVQTGAPIGADPRWPEGDNSSADGSVNDAPIGCSPRNGMARIEWWSRPTTVIGGSADVHSGTAAAYTEPRLWPNDLDRPDPPPFIISLDGTRHVPLTPLQLLALQSFPWQLNGKPVVLAGTSVAQWVKHIGNAVPPRAAQVMAEAIGMAMLIAEYGQPARNADGSFWVDHQELEEMMAELRMEAV